jgi:phytoene dehydrogenase-like protein
MATSCDVIVIGSGLNELVAAGLLAKAGRRVLVLEARAALGGAMVTEELTPGFRIDAGAHDAGWLSPRIVQALGLGRHGLTLLESDATCFAPMADGAPLVLWRDQAKTVESIRRRSPTDAARWPEFAARMGRLSGFLEHAYAAPPPRPVGTRPADLLALLGVGLRLRGMGRTSMVELLRVLPMPVADLLDEWFADDGLKGTLGAGGITHLFQGPRSAGTAFLMLHHQVGRPAGCFRACTTARGGVGALVSALAAAARGWGAEIRTGAEVTRIVVRDGRVTGVVLQTGEELAARIVASGADARRTFLDLMDPGESDPEFLRAVQHIKARGVWAKVNMALDGLPEFTALPGDGPHLRGVISISPSLNHLERAYDAAKHGGVSARPYLEAVIPSLADPGLAPAGKHVMSVAMQYAPYQPKDGPWTDARRDALGDRVVNLLTEFAPNLKGLIRNRQVLTPVDLEARYGLPEGQLYQGELSLDQALFMRPVPGWAHSATPIEGLYLCGSGAHPGGGIAGGAGALAAKVILKDG